MVFDRRLIIVPVTLIIIGLGYFYYASGTVGGDTSQSDSSETKIIYDYTPDKFENALKSGMPTLLEFAADWCIPCRRMAPFMKELKEEYHGKANILTVNADKELDMVRDYGVRNLPTLIFFNKKGELFKTVAGYQSKESIKSVLDDLI